jgi:putative restriction endonuclease
VVADFGYVLAMAKAVFTIRAHSIYDDLPEQQYHFPKIYLRTANAAVGDWILYYVPSKESVRQWGLGAVQAYVSAAFISHITPDPARADHYYAWVGDYAPFVRPVPFRRDNHYFERKLRSEDGSTNQGTARRSVRSISDDEFNEIWVEGTSLIIGEIQPDQRAVPPGFADEPLEFDRPVVEQLVNRKVRDALFQRTVRDAYDARCAVTGLRILNGGGRAEIEAAHIRPVADKGPDSPRNGIALCRTAHWMFDRGLIGLKSGGLFDVNIAKVPEDARRMLRQDGKLILPNSNGLRPADKFVEWHWQNRFGPKLV